jgi:hypothetical protein
MVFWGSQKFDNVFYTSIRVFMKKVKKDMRIFNLAALR